MAVNCGHVYFLYLPIAEKDKLLVPAYIKPDGRACFFVINTERTEFQQNNPDIARHVIALPCANNGNFLKHDSWLACHEAIGGWTAAGIDAITGCYRGPLDGGTLTSVRKVIQESRLYSEIVKTQILEQWPGQ